MNATKQYTAYKLTDGDFTMRVKVSKDDISLVNKNKQYPRTFEFDRSKPELIATFAKAMNLAVKLSKESDV